MRKQACKKCIFWELMIKEGITEPQILELIRCEFETPLTNPKDTECEHMDFARKISKVYGFI